MEKAHSSPRGLKKKKTYFFGPDFRLQLSSTPRSSGAEQRTTEPGPSMLCSTQNQQLPSAGAASRFPIVTRSQHSASQRLHL